MEDRNLISSAEAARMLGLRTDGWLRKMRCERDARLPYFRLGRTVRYDEADVLAFREACRVTPQTMAA